MDYEKEYKQLRKFIGDLYPYMSEYCKEKVEGFFPEFRESEDERMKRVITHILYENYTDAAVIEGVEISEIITWLEKQCEQKHKDKYTFNSIPRLLEMIEPTDKAKAYCQKLIDSLQQEGYVTDAKIISQHLKLMNGEEVSMAVMDEKQGEQESTNKVEPKFKVSNWINWIITDERVYTAKIININDDKYEVEFIDGSKGFYLIDFIDKYYHHWTIEDAKDGDVLTYDLDNGKVLIMIYEGLGTSFDGEVGVHALLDGGGHFAESAACVCCKFMENLTPATNEQRDLLFQKMAEAGYKWDAGKKELSTIS